MKELAQVAYEALLEGVRWSGGLSWAALDPLTKEGWQRVANAVLNQFYLDGSGSVHSRLTQIEVVQNQILEVVMKTQADLDAGIATLTADDVAVLAAVQTSATAIDPVSDFTAEVTALAQTHTDFTAAIASLQAVSATATADDPGATPAAPAPPAAS
jgi:hypothetical protein